MWVVDTCVILDVFEDDPQFGRDSAKLLEKLLAEGLAVSPVSMVELAERTENGRLLRARGVLCGEYSDRPPVNRWRRPVSRPGGATPTARLPQSKRNSPPS